MSAIPIGASSKAERKRSSASASAAWDCMRSATSRTVAWLSTTARVAGSRTTRRRVSTHTEPAARRMRWVIDTGASSRLAEQRRDAGGVLLVDEVGERAAEQRVGLEPQQVAAGGRGVAHGAVGLEHADQVGGGLGEHARALLGLEPRELGAVALGAADGDQPERVALAAQRLRADDRDQDRQQPADQQRGEREPLARRGLLDGDGPHAVAEPHALAAAGGGGRATGSSPSATATRVPSCRWEATASRTPAAENVVRNAPETPEPAAARTGTATAMLARRAVDRGQDLGGAGLARADRALQRGAAGRLLDRLRASGSPLPRELREDDREALGAAAGLVGAGAHGRAAAGAAGERDRGQRAAGRAGARRARRTARAARTAGPARSRRRR